MTITIMGGGPWLVDEARVFSFAPESYSLESPMRLKECHQNTAYSEFCRDNMKDF